MRSDTSITAFITSAMVKNVDLESAYTLFVNGLDLCMNPVSLETYYERAKCMSDMRLEWLSKW